jgi:hypothetical protein
LGDMFIEGQLVLLTKGHTRTTNPRSLITPSCSFLVKVAIISAIKGVNSRYTVIMIRDSSGSSPSKTVDLCIYALRRNDTHD